jgi:hypothetical protein
MCTIHLHIRSRFGPTTVWLNVYQAMIDESDLDLFQEIVAVSDVQPNIDAHAGDAQQGNGSIDPLDVDTELDEFAQLAGIAANAIVPTRHFEQRSIDLLRKAQAARSKACAKRKLDKALDRNRTLEAVAQCVAKETTMVQAMLGDTFEVKTWSLDIRAAVASRLAFRPKIRGGADRAKKAAQSRAVGTLIGSVLPLQMIVVTACSHALHIYC